MLTVMPCDTPGRAGHDPQEAGPRRPRGSGPVAPVHAPEDPCAAGAAILVRVRDLRGSDSPRLSGLNQDHVRALAEVEDELPPITVHHATMRVVDGAHRLAAARLLGRSEIAVRFVHGDPDDAFRMSVTANVTHGLPLSLADRRAAAARIIGATPGLSDRAVARIAGLAHKTVAAIRARDGAGQDQDQPRRGLDGRSRPLSAEAGRIAASRIMATRPDASLREVAREAGISLGTARDVRVRLLAGQDPVPSRKSGAAVPAVPPAISPTRQADISELMEGLRRDPMLRYSDSGRRLLRWLDARVVMAEELNEMSDGIPPHCLERISNLARECARAWASFAEGTACS